MSCPVDELVHKRQEAASEELEEVPIREEVLRFADAEELILELQIGKASHWKIRKNPQFLMLKNFYLTPLIAEGDLEEELEGEELPAVVSCHREQESSKSQALTDSRFFPKLKLYCLRDHFLEK